MEGTPYRKFNTAFDGCKQNEGSYKAELFTRIGTRSAVIVAYYDYETSNCGQTKSEQGRVVGHQVKGSVRGALATAVRPKADLPVVEEEDGYVVCQ